MPSESEDSNYRGILRVFDRPLSRDWVFWVFAVITSASLVSGLRSFQPGAIGDPVSGVVDAAFSVAVNYVLWAAIPSAVRSRIRAWRDRAGSKGLDERSRPDFVPHESGAEAPSLPILERAERFTHASGLAVAGMALIVLGLFAHGNWEYIRLLSTIRGGEAIVEGYKRETKVLEELFDSRSPTFSRSRRDEAIVKWQSVASRRNEELLPWLRRFQDGGVAPWNSGTERVREAAGIHFDAWHRHLESVSLNLFYSDWTTNTRVINSSFRALCLSLESFQSRFAWPSVSSARMSDRVDDICDD